MNDSRGYSSSSAGGGSGGGGGGSNRYVPPPAASTASGHSSSSSSGSGSSNVFTKSPELKSRMKGLLREYLSVRDIRELRLSLTEATSTSVSGGSSSVTACKETPGYFIDALLTQFMDTSSKEVLAALMALLSDPEIVDYLSYPPHQLMAETALQSFEPLLLLLDTLNDNPHAHERLGTVIGILIRINACRGSIVQDLVNDCCSAEKAQMQEVGVDDLQSTYTLFVNALGIN